MNIFDKSLFLNFNNYIDENLFVSLSPLQKKVAIFVISFFSCVALGYALYRSYCFKAKKLIEIKNETGSFICPAKYQPYFELAPKDFVKKIFGSSLYSPEEKNQSFHDPLAQIMAIAITKISLSRRSG